MAELGAGAREGYTMGYDEAAMTWLQGRSVQSHAQFFLPYLEPGMTLLDCGCGPGAITLGLAEKLAPGEVIGVDIEPSQVDLARRMAQEKKIANVRFEAASVYDLPYEDNSFDAVFASAILGNLDAPQRAVVEMYRVLKPGGVAGFHEFDHDGDLFYPLNPTLAKSVKLYERLRQHIGHDPAGGRRLKEWLSRAAFDLLDLGATFEMFEPADFAKGSIALFQGEMGNQMKALGWIDEQGIAEIPRMWADMVNNPDAFIATAWVHAVGRKG